jgi:hypothetical protein
MLRDIVFFSDVIMPTETFNTLPTAHSDGERLLADLKSDYGRVHRALIARSGRQMWHAIAWHNLNGRDRPIASRIIVRNYQQED